MSQTVYKTCKTNYRNNHVTFILKVKHLNSEPNSYMFKNSLTFKI